MNEEVNRNEVNRNIKKDEEDTRIMITRTAKFSMSSIKKGNKNMQ